MRFLLRLLVILAVAGWCQSVAAAVPSTSSYVDATGNGVTHVFTFTFAVTTTSSHVEVYLNESKQVVGYVVALNLNQASSPGGTVTFLANGLPNPPANGVRVRIQRMVPLTQETILSAYSAYRAKDVEKALDRLAYQTQQLDRYAKVNQAARDDAQDLVLTQGTFGGGTLLAANGTQNAPSVSFLSETGTGLYRAGAGDLRLAVLGLDRLRVGPTASAPAFTFTSPQADDGVQPDFVFDTTAARIDGHLFEVRSAGSSVLRLGWAGELRFAGSTPEIQVVTPDAALQVFTNRNAASAGTDLIISTSANRSAGLMLDLQNNSVSKLAVQPTGDLQLRGSPLAMWQRAVATSDTSNSATAAATDVAGLSFAAASGKKYLVRATLFTYAAATTTGLGVSAKATGAPTTSSQFFSQLHWLDTGNVAQGAGSAFADTPTVFAATLQTTAGAPQVDRFDGYFVTTGTGAFQLRLITEVNTSAVTVKAGSYLEWMEL